MLFRRFGGWLLTPLSGSLLVSVVLGLQAHSKPFFCRFWTRRLTSQHSKRRPKIGARVSPFRRVAFDAPFWLFAGLCSAGPTSSFQAFFLSVLDATFDIAVLQTEAENWCTWTRDTMLFRRFGGWLLTPLSGSLLVSVVLGLQAHSKPFFCRFWTRRLTSQHSKRRLKIGAREPATPCCVAVSEGGFWRPFLPLICWSWLCWADKLIPSLFFLGSGRNVWPRSPPNGGRKLVHVNPRHHAVSPFQRVAFDAPFWLFAGLCSAGPTSSFQAFFL